MSDAKLLEPAPETVTDAASFAAVAGAGPEQVRDLERYRDLLAEWNQKMNLVGASTLDAFWSRHAWDSAQLLPLAPEARVWADLGAGAGLPGVVLAIMRKGDPAFHVHLVESMAKRCRFLRAVVGELGLSATVHNARAEDLRLTVDIVTARACAPLHRLLGYAKPFLQRGATGLFLKGQDVATELEEATRFWDYEADVLPSRSDARGRIVRVRRLGRARKA
ncbi:MAG: 16S rRNA (guanine(527)-N(7))-methyltransferase RsmG [Phenylobacterium sp.]|jgi:16S rRNA (guanine527-N7)-methyltransferase|uniref:16S rRNA (guanine(527)-N(7))-methyltransferase RsmG n=1 Tax=Phenylobacterium sp. TaxID=1871053 RepID=UPI002A2FCFB6|nr:16S rRNA (guanine(527)-N(7))-methyltransferase RsmG [Phenylobacterium sp.]MDD3838442.1 16S rRNA (guanine(527)-N(7))-methyltransferase RsmG [Phenylobacterium sp.]MDX9998412.1 16S rRNA (guanine(527)-N(7))-methyltransferase RsmG [Phenylobacterium sp.]